MDPLIIHHVIRHRLSRIETNNFQDKSGCSINGIRSFLFEEGIVQDLDDMENLLNNYFTLQDYRGFPIELGIDNFENFPLSDEILRMKNVKFNFLLHHKPIHKLVSPEPHFVEEEKNLIENHFSYLGSMYYGEDIEDGNVLRWIMKVIWFQFILPFFNYQMNQLNISPTSLISQVFNPLHLHRKVMKKS